MGEGVAAAALPSYAPPFLTLLSRTHMAQTTFTVTHERASDLKLKETDSPRLTLQKLSTFLNGLAGGLYIGTAFNVSNDAASATVTLSGVDGAAATGSYALSNVGGTAATGSYALSDVGGEVANNNVTFSSSNGAWTVTIRGVVFGGTSVGDDEAEALDLTNQINSSVDPLIAGIIEAQDEGGGLVNLFAVAKGTAANAYTVAVTGTGVSRFSATFTGGIDGAVTVEINGTSVGPVDTTNLSDTAAATAVAAAIEANGTLGPLLAAVGSTTNVSITWGAKGTAGNAVTLAAGVSATGTATRSGATLSGGAQGAVTVAIAGTTIGPTDTTNLTDTDAATAVAAAIEANGTIGPQIVAVGSTTNVSLTWGTKGTVGNAVTLAAGTSATGTATRSGATLSGGADNDVTVTVGGVGVVTDTTTLANTAAATAVAAAINADSDAGDLVTASASSNVVTLTAKVSGEEGNGITLTSATDAGTATASSATLTGGSEFTYTL